MINILIAVIGTLYGSYTDLKKGIIPDWTSHSMIILGFIWTIFNYEFNQLIYIWGVAAVVFGVGYLLYIFGEMGGGDTKLFTALALLIPFYGHEIYPFILPVYILAGIFLMFLMPIQFFTKILKKRKKVKKFNSKLGQIVIFEIILIGFGIYWWINFGSLALLILPIMSSVLIVPFKKDITEIFFAQRKLISKIDEEDVIALELLKKGVKEKLKLWRKTLTLKEIKELKKMAKKHKIKSVIVCENLPKFIPYIFLSLMINLFYGDVLLLLFNSLMPF